MTWFTNFCAVDLSYADFFVARWEIIFWRTRPREVVQGSHLIGVYTKFYAKTRRYKA